MVNVFEVPLTIVPSVQVPVDEPKVPWVEEAETNVTPAGRRSLTETPVAFCGPAFVTVTV
jgi:hypothetical protein